MVRATARSGTRYSNDNGLIVVMAKVRVVVEFVVFLVLALYSPQRKFAGTDSSIFFGFGRFSAAMIATNSSFDNKSFVAGGKRGQRTKSRRHKTDRRQA